MTLENSSIIPTSLVYVTDKRIGSNKFKDKDIIKVKRNLM